MTATEAPNYIGGEDVTSGAWFDVTDPGKPSVVVGRAQNGTAADVDAAVAAAQAASAAWAATPVAERAAAFRAGVQRIREAQPELAELLMHENGGLRIESELDLGRSLELSEDILERGIAHLEPRVVVRGNDTVNILRKPIGPIAMIVPWNSPMVLAASKYAPALIAGNTIVLKPSPDAPLTLTKTLRLLGSALPAGVINVVNSVEEAGPALTSHPGVRKVSFTGSTAVGRDIMRSAAADIKRISLELGGNDAAIVLKDADLETAIPLLARGAFTRAGQICFGVKRVYVDRSIFTEFVDKFRAHVNTFVCGHGEDPASSYGPLINQRQLDRVRGIIAATEAAGATVETLGSISPEAQRDGGFYLQPTIVTNVDQHDPLVTEEQFGPVLPILPFDTEEEAIALANDTDFGLASSVWSIDEAHALTVATQLEAGCTFINSHNIWSLSFDMPFGGVKQSGLGRERTELGIDEYVETHAIRMATPAS